MSKSNNNPRLSILDKQNILMDTEEDKSIPEEEYHFEDFNRHYSSDYVKESRFIIT